MNSLSTKAKEPPSRGAPLAYEVLSNVCREKISMPVSILSHDLSLAGFSAPQILTDGPDARKGRES